MDIKRLVATTLLASAFSVAAANENASALGTCVDLGADREITRHGDTSSFTLRDGDTQYLVTLRDTCNALRSAEKVSIGTRGVGGRICPKGTKVETRYDICSVKKIERIDAGDLQARADYVPR